MERLKAILADKILDISSASGDEVKVKIDKIQRFRDFAIACQTLMVRYPQIEDELIKMIHDGDFDTKVAASRVDTVIRLTDTEAAQKSRLTVQIEEPAVLGEPSEILITAEDGMFDKSETEASQAEMPDAFNEVLIESIESEEEPVCEPEEVGYEEIDTTPEEEAEQGYVPFESVIFDQEADDDIDAYANLAEENKNTPDKGQESSVDTFADEEAANDDGSSTMKKVLQIAGIVLAVVALIFIIKFVINNLQTVLVGIGIAVVLAILIYWFKRKRG